MEKKVRAKITVLCNCKRRHQLYSVRHLLKLQEVRFFFLFQFIFSVVNIRCIVLH